MKEYTYAETLELAKQIIAQEGEDFVYTKKPNPESCCNDCDCQETTFCYYVWQGKPDCVVGRMFHTLGAPLDVLSGFENESATRVAHGLAKLGFFSFDEDSLSFLMGLQTTQDGGTPWGVALAQSMIR